MTQISTWSLLVLSLPTENATARMRYWRALKARGCAVLRDGVYLLPYNAEREGMLRELAESIGDSGGTAHLLRTPSLDAAQEAYFRGLFDRSDDYDNVVQSLAEARKAMSAQSPAELARLQRRLQKDYESVAAIDYFPTEAAARAAAAWGDFVSHIETVLSPGEPHAAHQPNAPLKREDYQRRIWATRRRLWVDRVASAWLIGRFIDLEARFVWLESPKACPADALGFDFDGAAFTHVDERVTFEVLLATFGLDHDAALLRLGQLVHALDVGGESVPEASGFEAVLAGTREGAPDDDQLLDAMMPVLDALYAHFAASTKHKESRRRS